MKTKALVAAAALFLPALSFADTYTHYNKAVDAYKQQIYVSAISEAETQLRDTPNHTPSWLLIARIYLTLNKCVEAGNAAASAYTLMGQPPAPSAELQEQFEKIAMDLTAQCGASLDLGRAYMQAKDYESASDQYRGYLQKNPNDQATRFEFARILSWGRNYSEAIEQYKLYLKAHPGDTPATLGLADVYAWSGDLPDAESLLKKILSREPGNREARARLSRMKNLTTTERRPTPTATIQSDIARTGNRSLYMKLGDALYHNDDKIDEALVAYRRYLKEFPEDSTATLKVARILGWEKRYDGAAPLFRAYLEKYPNDNAVRLELANILAWEGRRAEALTELERIKRDNPAQPAAYVAAGDIYRWENRYPEASENYRTAVTMDPDNERAAEGLRDITRQWSTTPSVRTSGEELSVSDIRFRRRSEDLGADIHVNDGRIHLAPGVRAYQFKQGDDSLHAREVYINGEIPIQNDWHWWGGLSGIQFADRGARLQGSLGVEGTISTHTWVRAGYTSQDNVFESSNLSALLNGNALRLDNYSVDFARSLPGQNKIQGLVSAGFLSDSNSRTRLLIEGLHQITDAPLVNVGIAYKALSFAHTSPLYWSPSAYSGPGVVADLERKWDAFSYKIGMKMFRITQTSLTEAGVEGDVAYRPLNGFFAELTLGLSRAAGAAPEGTPNTQYKDILLSAGYKF